MLYTSIGQEMLWVLISFVQTKSLSMKLPVALESKSTLMECTLLVSVVLISIGRTMDVLWALRVLAESHLDSLFFHFGFWGRAFLSRVEIMDVSIGSLVSVLVSSAFNTVNLFTDSNQGILFTGHAVIPQMNFLQKITFDMLYTNEFLIRVCSRTLSISSECTTI